MNKFDSKEKTANLISVDPALFQGVSDAQAEKVKGGSPAEDFIFVPHRVWDIVDGVAIYGYSPNK